MPRLRVVLIATLIAVTGCAVTPQQFSQRKNTMSDTDVCRAATAARQTKDDSYIAMVNQEGERRALTVEKCKTLIAESDKNNAIAAVALVGMAAVALASSQDNGAAPVNKKNEEYAWARAYNNKRQLVWVCKEVATGKLEEPEDCKGLPKPGRD